MEIQTIPNPINSAAAKGDRRSCTINALSNAAEIPFDVAQQIGFKAGRVVNRGFQGSKLIPVAKRYGVVARKLRFKRMTLRKFIKTHPVGRYYVENNRHAFAVVNGAVVDWLENAAGCILEKAWHITSSGTNGRQVKLKKPRPVRATYRVTYFSPDNVLANVAKHKRKGDAIRQARLVKKNGCAVMVYEVTGVYDRRDVVIYFADKNNRLKNLGFKKPTKNND